LSSSHFIVSKICSDHQRFSGSVCEELENPLFRTATGGLILLSCTNLHYSLACCIPKQIISNAQFHPFIFFFDAAYPEQR